MKLHVRTTSGKTHTLDVELTDTVASVKARLEGVTDLPPAQQKLTLKGKAMDDDSELSTFDFGIKAAIMLIRQRVKKSSGSSPGGASPSRATPTQRQLCKTGCGYWGDSSSDGYCSTCFRKKQEQEEAERRAAREAAKAAAKQAGGDEDGDPMQDIEVEQTDFTRCWQCNHRIGLLGFPCCCGYKFCAKHRHSTEHNCPVDYKQYDKLRLKKQNPSLPTSKMREKI